MVDVPQLCGLSCGCVRAQYQQEIALLQEKLRVAALRQEECEARLMVQDQQNQRMLQEYQVCGWADPPPEAWLQKSHGRFFSGSLGGHREQTEEAAGRQRPADEQHHQQVNSAPSTSPAAACGRVSRVVCAG